MKAKGSTRRAVLSILVVCALLTLPLLAQNPRAVSAFKDPQKPAPDKKDKTIKVDVDLVLVNVTVTDPFNRLVTGLEQENFRAFEDNAEQEIVHFSSEDVPISIGVIFDMSGSMSNKVDK